MEHTNDTLIRQEDAVSPRRNFLKTLAVLGAGTVFAPNILSARNINSKLNIAVVGVGGRGSANIAELVHKANGSEKLLAFCDVNVNTLNAQSKKYKVEHSYADYRELLDKHAGELDGILIATLDHTHGIIACDAMSRGIHCYCEKPLARTVWENRQMALWAKAKKLCTQTGTQVRSWGAGKNAHYYRAIELIRAGAIGDPTAIEDVHVWCAGNYVPRKDPTGTSPVPAWLNYDLWLGPTPKIPYNDAWLSFSKYGFWHSGCGFLSGMGPHTIDLVWTALNLSPPTQIELLETPAPHPLYNRDFQHVVWTHPRAGGKPLRVHWYDGNLKPKNIPSHLANLKRGAGVLFVGASGNLQVHYGHHTLFPAEKFANLVPPAPTYKQSKGHQRQWLEAIKAGKPEQCECRFEYAAAYTEAITVATQAHRVGVKKVTWDAAAMKTDSASVNKFIKPEFRDGWNFPIVKKAEEKKA
ncbi:MAG: Gfo/Idh/MocA family oxidoreductase [Puniceicoccales bacterium]|jgi:predicted dehydrogenase|nr:Gfo/Idh/MocA family oxidoreductase [Puniceicoccales bacterium]